MERREPSNEHSDWRTELSHKKDIAINLRYQLSVVLLVAALVLPPVGKSLVSACTGITLRAADGTVVYGRTLDLSPYILTRCATVDGARAALETIEVVAVTDLDFKALGGGSGMIGIPGDFTPPSRFVRAVAFSHTVRARKGNLP